MKNNNLPVFDADAEKFVLCSILINNNALDVVNSVINSTDFYFESSRIILNCMNFLKRQGILIDPETLGHALIRSGDMKKIGGASVFSEILDRCSTSVNTPYYANIVRELSAKRRILEIAKNLTDRINLGIDVDLISDHIGDIADAAKDLYRNEMPDSLFSLGNDVVNNYKLSASGYRGIPFPWPTIDNMTAGMWPKTTTVFVARPATGKTFIAVICGRHAWLQNKRVLIISPEMSKVDIAERFFVTHAKVPYHDVIMGKLPTFREHGFYSSIESLSDATGIWIMDASDDLTPSNMDAKIRACNPDLVAIDSIYRIKVKGDRKERASLALEWIAESSEKNGYAAVCFAQQNRGAEVSEKKGGGSRLGTIALTDDIAQDAQTIFAIEQSKDEKADRILKIRPLKVRRGQYKNPVVKLNWDFDGMNFDEIDSDDDESDEFEGGKVPF